MSDVFPNTLDCYFVSELSDQTVTLEQYNRLGGMPAQPEQDVIDGPRIEAVPASSSDLRLRRIAIRAQAIDVMLASLLEP